MNCVALRGKFFGELKLVVIQQRWIWDNNQRDLNA